MSTPIEIVRAQWDWMRSESRELPPLPHPWDEYDAALAAVLADAERFKALELAHDKGPEQAGWFRWSDETENHYKVGPLAELADRLREGA